MKKNNHPINGFNNTYEITVVGQINSRCFLVLFMFILSLCFIAGCSEKTKQILDENTLQAKTKLDSPIKLSSILNLKSGTVCILYPYQDRVPSNIPESAKINSFLKNNNYVADEGHWALVFVEGDTINLSRFRRSVSLDVLPLHELNDQLKGKIPANFEPAYCVPIEHAAFLKIHFKNYNYIILGRSM